MAGGYEGVGEVDGDVEDCEVVVAWLGYLYLRPLNPAMQRSKDSSTPRITTPIDVTAKQFQRK